MLEALTEWMSQTHLYANYGGAAPERSGGMHASIAPYGPFPTSTGTVFFGLQNEREWATFCSEVLEQADLAHDERFTPNFKRVENRASLHEIIEQVTRGLTSDELITKLDAIGIANARMRDMFELDRHPQLAERNRWRDVQVPNGTAHGLVPPFMPVGMDPQWGEVPTIGQHTEAVLDEFLVSSTESVKGA